MQASIFPAVLQRFAIRIRRRHPRLVRLEWLALTMILCVTGALFSLTRLLSPMDNWWYDALLVRHSLPAPKDVVLITIEPDTLDRDNLSRRIWRLGDTAELLDHLSQSDPAAIWLSFDLSNANPLDPSGEQMLAAAIKRSGKVVLPIALQTVGAKVAGFRLPIARLANPTAALAQDRHAAQRDGIVRYIPLAITNGEISWPHAAKELLNVARWPFPIPASEPAATAASTGWDETEPLYLRFIGQADNFETFSARDILNGEIASETFRNKMVLIGPSRLEYQVAIPEFGNRGRTISTLELVGNGVNTLRRHAWISPVPTAVSAIWTVCAIFSALLVFFLAPTHRQFFLLLVGIVALLAASSLLFFVADIWFPCASAVAMIASAYPLWAWRRLEATQRFLAAEQRKFMLDTKLAPIGTEPYDHMPTASGSMEQQLLFIREAGDRLRAARKLVSDVIDSLPAAVYLASADGRLILANQQGILAAGLNSTSESLSLHLIEILQRFQFPAQAQRDPRSWNDGFSVEVTGTANSAYWLNSRRIGLGETESMGTIVVLTEITALRQAERQHRELLHFVSHDLRSPLASVLAVANSRDERPDERSDESRFDAIRRYTQQSLNLAQEFLHLAYAEDADPAEFITTDLLLVIDEAIDTCRPLAAQHRVDIETALPVTAFVEGSQALLERLFTNLIHNAVKFSPEGKSVKVSLSLNQGFWSCTIHNVINAVPPDTVPAKKEARAKLGLALVKAVAEKHGGHFHLENSPQEVTAVINLPAEIL